MSQSKNFRVAIADGQLWSSPTVTGVEPPARSDMKLMEVGDTVFHFGKQYVRAISHVSQAWVPSPAPSRGYDYSGSPFPGWLVEVDVFADDLAIPFSRVAELISRRGTSPITVTGGAVEKFVIRLDDLEGEALLEEAGVTPPGASLFGLPLNLWGEGTDAEGFQQVRLEQAALRRHLLHGRASGVCSICQRELPARFLVAAHIAPRRTLTDLERQQFDSIAMLLCSLGCDALFEWGYLVVDDRGVLQPSGKEATVDLRSVIARWSGDVCLGFRAETALSFGRHRAAHLHE